MEEKLKKLYEECIKELDLIKINIIDNPEIGQININFAKRSSKGYGCCKQENPDKNYYNILKRGRTKIKQYDIFKKHHI